jgi:hypothetical protein
VRRGADLRVPAPGQAKKVAMMGALDWLQRKLIVATSRTKRSTDFIALLVTLDHLYGPKPGVATKPVVIVLDNGPIHVSKATSAALAARAHWLTVEWLPKYSKFKTFLRKVGARTVRASLEQFARSSQQLGLANVPTTSGMQATLQYDRNPL